MKYTVFIISLILCQQFEDTIPAICLERCLQYYGSIKKMFYYLYILDDVFNVTLMEYFRNELDGKLFELLYNELIKYLNKREQFIRNNKNYSQNYNQISMGGLKHSARNVCETVSDFNENNVELMDTVNCYFWYSFDRVDRIKINNLNAMNCNQNETEMSMKCFMINKWKN